MSGTQDYPVPSSRGTWREPPSPKRILTACGWLAAADSKDHALKLDSLSCSHTVFKATALDGRSVIVKHMARKAWESGRSLVRELYVYRLASWVQELSEILPKPLLVDERQQVLVMEWIATCQVHLPHTIDLWVMNPEVATSLGRALATCHRVTAGIFLIPAFADGILNLPDSLEVAIQGRSQGSQDFMKSILADLKLTQALREGQLMYQHKCLIHGDIRWSNWIVQSFGAKASIKLIDWELSGSGDPAWDVASACAELILDVVRLSLAGIGASGWPIAVEPALERLISAYCTGGGLLSRDESKEWDRVVLFTISRLLHVGCEWTDHDGIVEIEPVNAIVEQARALLNQRRVAGTSLQHWATGKIA